MTPPGYCAANQDKDGDGFNANQDPCDNNPNNSQCDTDGDGIPDQYDPCPTLASGHLLGQTQPLPNQDVNYCPAVDGQPPGANPGTSPDFTDGNAVSPDQLSAAFPLPTDQPFDIESDPGVAAPQVALKTKFRHAFRHGHFGVRVGRLALSHVAGFAIELRCSGPGCPFRREVRLPTLADSYDAASKKLKAATLGQGARLTLRVIRSELVGRFYVFRMGQQFELAGGRRHNGVSTRHSGVGVISRCVPPSSSKPIHCPLIGAAARKGYRLLTAEQARFTPRVGSDPLIGRTVSGPLRRALTPVIDWAWSGPQFRGYWSRAATHAAGGACGACGSVKTGLCGGLGVLVSETVVGTAIVLGVCDYVVGSWVSWVQAWARYADSLHGCLEIDITPLSIRAWREPGYWAQINAGPVPTWVRWNLHANNGSHCHNS